MTISTSITSKRAVRSFLIGLSACLLLAACGSPGSIPTQNLGTSVNAPMARVVLRHTPTGMASLSWDPATHTLSVQISMKGLAPHSIHPAHIHAGSCYSAGKVVYPLQDLVANAEGQAMAMTMIAKVPAGIPVQGWYINVHNGPNMTPPDQAQAIACGDIVNLNAMPNMKQTLQVNIGGVPEPNQMASGTAELWLAKGTLTVRVTMSGLDPASAHTVHIHNGSCDKQGAIAYMLNPIVADGGGNATSTTTIEQVSAIPSTGWYINVHLTQDMSSQTTEDPIACGDVVVS